jgi:hypothetical protein
MSELREEGDIETTDNEIGEKDQDIKGITKPFAVKDIKITYAPILLPSVITRLEHDEISIPNYQRHENLWSIQQKSRLIESILFSNLYKSMKSFNPPIRTLMGPGPSDVHPRILSAMARPTIGHLDPAFG